MLNICKTMGLSMKNELFKYKGYLGTIEFDIEDGCLMGQILHINDLVTYEAQTLPELKKEFENSVDDYLELCQKLGRKAQKPFMGTFNIRISPEKHKELALKATRKDCSINEVVNKAIEQFLSADAKEVPHNLNPDFIFKIEKPREEPLFSKATFKYSNLKTTSEVKQWNS